MSTLAVFLAVPSDYSGPPALQSRWHSLRVPTAAHEVKPFLALLRTNLGVGETYGFKLSTLARRGGEGEQPPTGHADLKPITTLAEFSELFEKLEWADETKPLSLLVELKKKDGSSAGPAPSAAAPKFVAPSRATAKPVEVASPTRAAPQQQQSSVAHGERDPNYRSPFTQGSSSSSSAGSTSSQQQPMSAWARQQAEKAEREKAEGGGGGGGGALAAKQAMFRGGAQGGSRFGGGTGSNTASNGYSSSPAKPAAASPASSPSSAYSAPKPVAAATAAAPASSPSSSQPDPALVSSLRAMTLAAASPSKPPAGYPASSKPAASASADPDLPPAPQGFTDAVAPFRSVPISTISQPSNVNEFIPLARRANRPKPEVVALAAILEPQGPSATMSPPSGIPSEFLNFLKSNQGVLAQCYSDRAFGEMIKLCQEQEALYAKEVANGTLKAGSAERDRAGNGLLLYLYNLSQAHTARQEFSSAAEVAARFTAMYKTLPLSLQSLEANVEMHVKMRFNAGLALERSGQIQQALKELLAAAEVVEDGHRVRLAAGGPNAPLPGQPVPLRSEVCSAIGNLLSSPGVRDFAQAAPWHAKAVANESLRERDDKEWNIFHSAASCLAQKGEFQKAVELDTKALDLHTSNPRIYFNRGLCLQRLAQWGESLNDFAHALALDPTMYKAHTLRAKAMLQLNKGNWQEIVAECDEALRGTPDDKQAKEFKAHAQQRL